MVSLLYQHKNCIIIRKEKVVRTTLPHETAYAECQRIPDMRKYN